MAGNNLAIVNTGLDHCYLNGIPIVEAELDIATIFKKVARISSLAVQADSFFEKKTNAQKLFSESHGEGDRITMDFLEEGINDFAPIFHPLQRLIPEGTYDTTPLEYATEGVTSDFSWPNPDSSSIFVNSIQVRCTGGNGDITFVIDGVELGTVTLPDFQVDNVNYLAYDLAGYLGGSGAHFFNYTHRENTRNNNIPQTIECRVSNETGDFSYDVKICAFKYDAIGWIKSLTEAGDVSLPSYKDDVVISSLIKPYEWVNGNCVKVGGVTVKRRSGSAYVTIVRNGVAGETRFLDRSTVGDDFFSFDDDTKTVSIELSEETRDFSYDLMINTELPKVVPSPALEVDSTWNPGKIIFRYQNMDTRGAYQKLNYTSETLRDIRVDPNIFQKVVDFSYEALKNYILKELYLAIGYDNKAVYYKNAYEKSRTDAKFWLRSEKGLQTQYHYAGV